MKEPAQKVAISVIVPTYNRQDYLGQAVDSIVKQTLNPAEIIVVDDGSDYDVQQLLSVYGEKLRVIKKSNGGKPSAVNLGVAEAIGNYIWVFDDDDVAEPDYLEKVTESLHKKPADYIYGWHYSAVANADGELVMSGERRPHFSDDSQTFVRLLEGCSVAHNAIIAKKQCYEELGGIDVSYPCSEDYEFELRLAHNYVGYFINVPSFARRIHDGERGGTGFSYKAEQRREKFLSHDRRFIRHYLSTLSLDCFIYGIDANANEAQKKRRAYINRMLVAANVGLWDIWGKDVDALNREGLIDSEPLSSPERKAIGLMISHQDYAVMKNSTQGISAAIKTLNSIGKLSRDWVRVIKTALFKNAIRQAKGRRFHLFFKLLRLSV